MNFPDIAKLINNISLWIASALFPQNPIDTQAQEMVADMAKIRRDDTDRFSSTKYPCPAYSFFAYRHQAVRAMIWRLKYRGDKTVAGLFAKRMYDQMCEELAELREWSNFVDPILVAIPVSRKKLRVRGFNQSAAICMALEEIDDSRFFKYLPNVLYKIKDTKSQARVKDKCSRLENLKDSFSIKDTSLVAGRNIILLDDVLTTGSTLTEATRVLKNAGAKNIIWVVVAH